jgi:hypothetical protein
MSADGSTGSACQSDSSLQFDVAESNGGAAGGGLSPDASAGLTCTACSAAIVSSYYEVNGAVVCARCRGALDTLGSGSRGGRLLKAAGMGFLAAIVGAALYFAIAAITGYELGLVAIAVGFMVGKAVRRGSGGRGGWAYQTMAVTFTYFAIVSTYIPLAVKEFRSNPTSRDSVLALAAQADRATDSLARANGDSAAAEAADSTLVSAAASGGAGVRQAGAPSAAARRRSDRHVSAGGVVLGVVVLLLFAAVAPLLAGASNIIGLLIIGIAVFEAWKLNKRVQLDITGPFRLATRSSPGEGTGSTVSG